VKKVMPGHRVFLEKKVKPDQKAKSDPLDQQVKKVKPDQKATPDPSDHKEKQAILVLLVPWD
jgi:hypothetical protein